jgi:hypothetical protein
MALVGCFRAEVTPTLGLGVSRAGRFINGSIIDMWQWRWLCTASLWQWWDSRLGFRLRGLPTFPLPALVIPTPAPPFFRFALSIPIHSKSKNAACPIRASGLFSRWNRLPVGSAYMLGVPVNGRLPRINQNSGMPCHTELAIA